MALTTTNQTDTMNTPDEPINHTAFRLTGTPDGDLLVTFYYLDITDKAAVDWQIATIFLSGDNRNVLYEGYLPNNTQHITAVSNLFKRISDRIVNCVRVERLVTTEKVKRGI